MTEFDYELVVDGTGAHITLTRLRDGVVKIFWMADSARDREELRSSMTDHMNSLTDEDQCSFFFPDKKTKNTGKGERVYVAPDLKNVKNLRVTDEGCFIGKKGKFEQVSTEIFHLELVKRFGQGSADKWLEEFSK